MTKIMFVWQFPSWLWTKKNQNIVRFILHWLFNIHGYYLKKIYSKILKTIFWSNEIVLCSIPFIIQYNLALEIPVLQEKKSQMYWFPSSFYNEFLCQKNMLFEFREILTLVTNVQCSEESVCAMQWRKCREIWLDNINMKKTQRIQQNICAV